ncbi:hypothetical protein OC842_004288 [Tilletia horrida]|uniref:Uncharacterized protein n=1 Tax=Tilletia horrida TaxID=155126 RepID=A0AAN6GCJ7_9BASI|nr:hypothetical protein OC842_004288 [Tilletia horrida]
MSAIAFLARDRPSNVYDDLASRAVLASRQDRDDIAARWTADAGNLLPRTLTMDDNAWLDSLLQARDVDELESRSDEVVVTDQADFLRRHFEEGADSFRLLREARDLLARSLDENDNSPQVRGFRDHMKNAAMEYACQAHPTSCAVYNKVTGSQVGAY